MQHLEFPVGLSTLAAVLVTCGFLSSGAFARDAATVGIQARALDSQPQSRAEADQAMDGAVAASVIGAISTQFRNREIAVRLDQVAVQPVSVRDRIVSGEGRLRIGNDTAWIPFQFDVLYDTRTSGATHPEITLGDARAAHEIALDSTIARDLDRRVDAALADEFAQQPVRLVFERVTTADAGQRYLRVEALGTADFAAEGSTPARVRGLYDRRTGEWLRLDYELGSTSNRVDPGGAVAIR